MIVGKGSMSAYAAGRARLISSQRLIVVADLVGFLQAAQLCFVRSLSFHTVAMQCLAAATVPMQVCVCQVLDKQSAIFQQAQKGHTANSR